MKDLIKEVAPFLLMKFWKRDQWNNEYFDGIGYSEALVEELSKRAEAVAYADAFGNVITATTKGFSRNTLTNTFDRPLFTFPPIHDIEAIENRVAEACIKAIKSIDDGEAPEYSHCLETLGSGEWRKHK